MTVPHVSGPAGPSTPLEALREFKEVQSRRVAHHQEWDEARQVFEQTNEETHKPAEEDHSNEVHSTTQTAHRCGPPPASNGDAVQQSSHYHSVALPMTDEVYSKILSLVTSGLLDCAHSTRAIETELRTALSRADLAGLVGKIQDEENAVLRAIVARDQAKRTAQLEGRDLSDDIAQYNVSVGQHRTTITELMEEVGAEMAELEFA